ncbi:hypothetical protein [Nocardioides flavus (ex Wang et al. 2016)]|uniref:hypothetical protein n=1 Tax=Nocardioides flavus (ex Wang et al. 2016) TaxID=2058780 RepID=UPI00174C174E|nr:hypothetical protein [Nocardioides flavus (ex Wang et al. 2016)]
MLGAALALTLAACGGSGEAASTSEASDVLLEGEQLDAMVAQVDKMGIVEWHGQLLTKNPDNGGKRIFDLDGRYSPSTGYSELSMDSAIDGDKQQVDYLVVAGRTYFNSDVWGPNAADCWADITDDPARSWALPTDLDPTWPVAAARAIRLSGDGVAVGVPAKAVITGMPRGLFPAVPAALDGVEAKAVVEPHGHLIEVGVDVVNMWNELPAEELAAIETRKAGWWAMTMKESQDGASIVPPKYVFDPAVTPPSQCKRV